MFKQLLREWLIPPGALKLWRRLHTPSIQKFWIGYPLPPSPHEESYFSKAGVKSITLTRSDDSRNAGEIRNGSCTLPLPNVGGDYAQLAVAVDAWNPEDRLEVLVGTQRTTHSCISGNDWLDLRVQVPLDMPAQIEVHCTRPAYVTMPRRVHVRPNKARPPHHVLIIVLDGLTPYLARGLRSDFLSGLDTPNIDRFFADGYAASNGWSTGEWTLPTVGSFFTGLYTSRHRMWHPTMPTQMPAGPTMATIFQNAGYHTLALSTANRFTPAYGSHRGFDRFIYHWPFPGRTTKNYDPARWCDEVLGHLDAHQHDRTFVYAHFPDTHPCWNVPPLTRAFNLRRHGDSTGHDLDALRTHPNAKIQGMMLNAIRLHELDRLLGGIFDFIDRNLRDYTHAVITADHGTPWEMLREHRPADEPYLVDHRVHVELRMRGPKVPKWLYDGLCSPTIDLMPTVLALSGLESPTGLDGRNLLDPGYRRSTVISESLYGASYEIAVRDNRRTYIEKYPMHGALGTVTGLSDYRRCFPRGTDDYGTPLTEGCEDLAAIASTHRDTVGMLK